CAGAAATSSPASPPGDRAELAALGRALFHSTTAWGQQPSRGPDMAGRQLACASCHSGPAYTDGRTHLVSPGRNPTLQAQLRGAIMSPLELNAAREPTARELDALAAYVLTLTPPKAQPGVDFDPVKAARGDE